MTSHEEKEFLSAYLDGELDASKRERLNSHLEFCAECRTEIKAIERTKTLLRLAPQKNMPSMLIARLEQKASELEERARTHWLTWPRIWIPAAGLALSALILMFWMMQPSSPKDAIPIESLLAAHHRYVEEGNLPPADLTSGAFSSKLASLASYEETNND